MYTGNDMTQGVLSQLLGSYDPQRRQQLMQQQQQARQQFQNVLEEPTPDPGPIQRMLGDYLQKYGSSGRDWGSMASAVGAEVGRTRQQQLEDLLRRQQAAENKAKQAGQDLQNEDAYAKAILATAGRTLGGRGGIGGQPSPEELRTVYNNSRNEAAQIAKDYQWDSAEQRSLWIEQQANTAVDNYVRKWSSHPLGPRGTDSAFDTTQVPGAQPTEQLSQPNMRQPAIQSTVDDRRRPVSTPKFNAAPSEMAPQDRAAFEELVRQYPNNPAQAEQGMADIAQRYGMLSTEGQAPSAPSLATPPYVPSPAPKDIPRMERAKAGGAQLAKVDATHYEEVITQANAAANQFEAFNQLEKIDPVTNKFAGVYQNVGEVMQALGQNPGTPLIQNAIKTRDADLIISQLRNASLKLENGVQTASDERRIAAELPKVTDMPEVWKFSLKLGKEASQRRIERAQFYQSMTQQDTANLSKVRSMWTNQIKQDPLTQFYGGKLIFRSDFINGIKRVNPGMTDEEAIAEWRALESEYQARGGRK